MWIGLSKEMYQNLINLVIIYTLQLQILKAHTNYQEIISLLKILPYKHIGYDFDLVFLFYSKAIICERRAVILFKAK